MKQQQKIRIVLLDVYNNKNHNNYKRRNNTTVKTQLGRG